jgi:hypothetical protein
MTRIQKVLHDYYPSPSSTALEENDLTERQRQNKQRKRFLHASLDEDISMRVLSGCQHQKLRRIRHRGQCCGARAVVATKSNEVYLNEKTGKKKKSQSQCPSPRENLWPWIFHSMTGWKLWRLMSVYWCIRQFFHYFDWRISLSLETSRQKLS